MHTQERRTSNSDAPNDLSMVKIMAIVQWNAIFAVCVSWLQNPPKWLDTKQAGSSPVEIIGYIIRLLLMATDTWTWNWAMATAICQYQGRVKGSRQKGAQPKQDRWHRQEELRPGGTPPDSRQKDTYNRQRHPTEGYQLSKILPTKWLPPGRRWTIIAYAAPVRVITGTTTVVLQINHEYTLQETDKVLIPPQGGVLLMKDERNVRLQGTECNRFTVVSQ